MGRTLAHWMLQLHTYVISHQSETKQNKTTQYKNVDITVLKVAVRIPVLWGQSVLEQEREDPIKRCPAINIPHCFLFATEQNAFAERWIRGGAVRRILFGHTDVIKLLLSGIAQSFSNNATNWTSEESRFDSRQEKQTYFFSNVTGIILWGRWIARRKIDHSPNLAQRFKNAWRYTTTYTRAFLACSEQNFILQ
jgi:hypothetical protein